MGAQAYASGLQTLPEELVDLLLTDWLSARLPFALHGLALIDVYRPFGVPATGDPASRGIAYTRHLYDWSRIGLLFSDADAWARESYGWGIDFDSDKALHRIGEALRFIGGTAYLEDLTEPQIQAFVPHLANSPFAIAMMKAPIIKAAGAPVAAEFGIAALPVSSGSPASKGLGIAPYAEGTIAQTLTPADGFKITIQGSVGAVGGVVFQFQPGTATVRKGIGATAYDGDFGVELLVGPDDPAQKLIFFGDADSTRVQADAVIARIGGSASNVAVDFHLAAGVKGLTAIIDPGDDGLLSAVISAPIIISGGDLVIGWRSGKGIYFEGGTAIEITVPVDLDLGPIHIHEFGLALGLARPVSITVTTSLDLTLGPLYAYAEKIGLKATLLEDANGRFGKHDLRFGFVPPSGYAIALDAAPIEGGGLLSIGDHEYRGALALKFQTFGFSAFGLLNTRMPDGRDGFSFAASIFGEFTVPLGFGFFLTGIGGVIGINRTVDTDALRAVLYEGRLDNILFPADPIRNAKTILDDMGAILPVREGQHVFGPVARIGWGQPVLIEVKLGLVLEVGADVRIVILGSLGINLPTKDAAIVALNITFFGEIDFSAGTISFDATLVNSRVLTFAIGGDAAVRTGWGPRIEHVVSIGGLHPQFPKPANLPDLRRLSISFGTNNPRITLTAYSAITSNSVQFGARAELYAKGPDIWLVGQLAAKGWVYFDALIYFDPFAFDVALGGGLQVLVDGDVIAGLGFDLRLRGPNRFIIDGSVWVTICGIDCGFDIHHEWGSARKLDTPGADAAAVLRAAIAERRSVESVASGTRSSGVTFVDVAGDGVVLDPLGGLRVTQKAVPLGIAIQKIGEAQVVGTANMLTLRAFDRNGVQVTTSPVRQDFVRGHFFRLSEAERLRATAFESFDAGFDFADQGLTGPIARVIEDVYAYEFIPIPMEDDNAGWGKPSIGLHAASAAFVGQHLRSSLDQITLPRDLRGVRLDAPRPVSLHASVYVDQAMMAAAPLRTVGDIPAAVAAGVVFSGLTVAEDAMHAMRRPQEGNPVVKDYIAMAMAA
ncbi:DUF6603 domain-containing protein [Humitalea sp. 24SJ18S-53]|uniref:DUF6603 domain-containing protein n=1 Tax=Humitalea sp. 24SJ18S-53 TaxID=3422307 RepID=UPI003D66F4AE